MRHNRRAVMAEQYKLYMRKNIFNGRYFVRNIQLIIGMIITIAVLFGVIFLIKDKNGTDKSVDSKTGISAKEALFGNNDVTEKEITASDESDVYEISSTEAVEDVDDISVSEITATVDAISDADDTAAGDAGVDSEVIDASPEEQDDDVIPADAIVSGVVAVVGDYNVSEITEDSSAAEETEKSEFDDRCIANVDETLNIRKEPSPDSDFVGMMERGSIARVIDTEGDWTKIKSGDVEGYVLSEFILTGKVAEKYAENYVTLRATALEDGVNIREDRSTDADILQVLNKDDSISVVEISEEDKDKDTSKDDDITWLTVMLESGQIGYVAQDYVDVDKLYTLAVSAEELQRREEERLAAERAAAEAAALAERQSSSSSSGGKSTSYKGATTTPITAASSGESLGSFYITAYCGCEKCSGGHNKTASGTTPTEGRTIAADTSVLPFGTQVVIDGIVYTVEDRGSGVVGNHIDIFFATHEDAMAFGSKSVTVYKY